MIYLAFRNLFQQKYRLALSIGGVALAIMLILLLNGFLSGIYVQVTAYLDNNPADLVIAQDGVTNLLSATSVLPSGTETSVRGVTGIAQSIPIISQFVIFDIHDQKVVAYLVGYDPDMGGGPWKLISGQQPKDDDEIVLDWIMAEEHNLSIGDTVELLNKEFTVVGLSDGTNSWMASFVFIEKRAAEQLFLTPDTSSFILISIRPGINQENLIARLEGRLQDVEIVPVESMKQNDLNLLVEVFATPLRMMVSIAFTVGTAILGLVIYTATVERQREYGVLKAVGATNYHLYRLVLIQGFVTAIAGVLLGVGMASLTAEWIMKYFPKFLIVFESNSILWTSISGIFMGLLAAILPARQIARLDPARAFRK